MKGCERQSASPFPTQGIMNRTGSNACLLGHGQHGMAWYVMAGVVAAFRDVTRGKDVAVKRVPGCQPFRKSCSEVAGKPGQEAILKLLRRRVFDNFLMLRRTPSSQLKASSVLVFFWQRGTSPRLREIKLMRHFCHPNLLQLHDARNPDCILADDGCCGA